MIRHTLSLFSFIIVHLPIIIIIRSKKERGTLQKSILKKKEAYNLEYLFK